VPDHVEPSRMADFQQEAHDRNWIRSAEVRAINTVPVL